jgi:transcriptional regulator with XRE-family HTH domain
VEPNQAPRSRLRELRLARGWTQFDVADRLARLAWSKGDTTDIGASADMISKWERGKKRPSPRYRHLLAALYRVDVDELGLNDATAGQARSTDDSLVGMLDDAARLLNKLGNAGRALRPHVLAALTDDVLTRRSVLAMLDATPLPPRETPEVSAADLETLADQCEAAYGSVPPAALLTTVAAQLRAGTDALTGPRSTGARQRVLRARVRLAILAGRLATHDDIGNVPATRAYFAEALDDAHELGDHTHVATVLGHTAELALRQSQPVAAQSHLAAARALTVTDQALATWLARIDVTARAGRGRHDAA